MFNPLRLLNAWGEKKTAEVEADRNRAKAAVDLMESVSDDIRESFGYRDRHGDPDEGSWELIGSAYKGHFGPNEKWMAGMARRLVRTNPNARAALMGMVKYLIGPGFSMVPKSDDQRVWYIWKDFTTSQRNRWELRVSEIVRRWLRDGEFFIRFYTTKTPAGGETALPVWKTTVRFIDPQDVRRSNTKLAEPSADVMNAGVECDPNDRETIVAYHVVDPVDQTKAERVPADQIYHGKFLADMDQERGDSFLQPVMKLFAYYEQWLRYRIVLNKVRTALVLVRKVNGSPDNVATVANSIPNSARAPSNVSLKESFKEGTVVTANNGIDYKMESANINAADAAQDGRNIILQIAAGTGEPEYLFGDASNNNYASSLMAEAPFIKEVEFLRQQLEFHFRQIYRRVLEAAVKAQAIEEPDESEFLASLTPKIIATNEDAGGQQADEQDTPELVKETPLEIFYGVDIEWPEIVHRELKDFAESMQIRRQNGWVDDRTAAEAFGVDYDEVVRKQAQLEENAAGNPLMKGAFGSGADPADGQASSEAASLLAELSPAERKAVMAAKNPEEVGAILSQHKKPAPAPAGGGQE